VIARTRALSPLGRAAVFVGIAVGVACATAPQVATFELAATDVRPPSSVGPLSIDDALSRGLYPEVERFLATIPKETIEKSPSLSAAAGRLLLARGDYATAFPVLERARDLESRPTRRAEIEWSLSQGAILWNDFAAARDYATGAVQDGYGLVPGFLRFLDAMSQVEVYTGAPFGESHETEFDLRGFDLVRVPLEVNGLQAGAIVDSGAVYTILTETFARKAGVREIPDSRASGRGLHKREFPVTFGIAENVTFCGFTLHEVPVMLMPDEALLFQTARGEFPVPAVLGAHLLKEFTTEIDYPGRKLRMTRADFRVPKRAAEQNLYFHRGRIFARTSINRTGWYQFLLDTGSELTMMTSAGLARAGLPSSNKLFPKKVYGIGKSQAQWGLVRELTIGVAGYAARFQDLTVRDDETSYEDGIVGNSFLGHFRVGIDFQKMVLSLHER
jgi:predicted aspartyl protease